MKTSNVSLMILAGAVLAAPAALSGQSRLELAAEWGWSEVGYPDRVAVRYETQRGPEPYRYGDRDHGRYDDDHYEDYRDGRHGKGRKGKKTRRYEIEPYRIPAGRVEVVYRAGHGANAAFCRDGRGHPVHGWSWCARAGWGHAGRGDHQARWIRAHFSNVHFGDGYPWRAYDRPWDVRLKKVVGGHVYDHLREHRDYIGARGSLEGRWVHLRNGGLVLQVQAGYTPLAEFVDYDRDGVADRVLLARYP